MRKLLTGDDLPDEVRSILRLRHAERASMADVAEELGVSDRTVVRWRRLMGLRTVPPPVPDEVIEALARAGGTVASIAAETGLAEITVSGRMRSMGLLKRSEGVPMHLFKDGVEYDAAPPRKPSGGLFEPVSVEGDGPLARRYREQLEERSKLQERLDD